ncbi:MAG: phosphoadenylyl-sulfate reductase [Spirochaetales bacterium]|nr:phosphoadenylyl-sulfate reductase [Spirochaetales bacterium]
MNELQQELEHQDAETILNWAFTSFSPEEIVIACSFQIEDQVICDMAIAGQHDVSILTIDTLRLNQEIYDTIRLFENKYGIRVQKIYPDSEEIQKMTAEKKENSFLNSKQDREACCFFRKVKPLAKSLTGKKAWITGLRREQSYNRKCIQKIEQDTRFNIIKINPLADWTLQEVWDYIKKQNIPYCVLYDRGYTSIGCEPCTRPATDPADIRSGRWWWETDSSRECGMHEK